jgi:hypothetical protein
MDWKQRYQYYYKNDYHRVALVRTQLKSQLKKKEVKWTDLMPLKEEEAKSSNCKRVGA